MEATQPFFASPVLDNLQREIFHSVVDPQQGQTKPSSWPASGVTPAVLEHHLGVTLSATWGIVTLGPLTR